MFYVIGCFIIVIGYAIAARASGVPSLWTKTALVAVFLSLVSNVALVATVAFNPNPSMNDGIAVPNRIAYWIIGEDGWSVHQFHRMLEQSIWCTLLITLIFATVSIGEALRRKRMGVGGA